MVRDPFVGLLLRITGFSPKIELNIRWSSKKIISQQKLVINGFELGVQMSMLMLGVILVAVEVRLSTGVLPLLLPLSMSSSLLVSFLVGRQKNQILVFHVVNIMTEISSY